MKKRGLVFCLVLALLMSNLGTISYAMEREESMIVSEESEIKSTGSTVISSYTQLVDALNTGGNYTIEGNIVTDLPNGDVPLVVKNDVTFSGGSISISNAGIILEADAAFNGTNLQFTNAAYMGIFANGHNLTLANLTISWDYYDPFTIAAGGVKNNSFFTNVSGTESNIILESVSFSNSKDQGVNIYAGNVYNATPLDEGPDGKLQEIQGASASFPVNFTIKQSSGNKPAVYGHGAVYTGFYPGNKELSTTNYDKIFSSESCSVEGEVYITLGNGSDAKEINGSTGTNTNKGAIVSVSSSTGYLSTLKAKNLSGLNLLAGTYNPNITLANISDNEGSSFYSDASIAVPEGTRLDIASLEENITIGSFSGGGKVIMGQEQCLTITGAVENATEIEITGVSGSGGVLPKVERIYIVAAGSQANSFSLVPPNFQTADFIYNGTNGNWSVPAASTATTIDRIKSLSIEGGKESITIYADQIAVYDGFLVEWAEDVSISDLGWLPLDIEYNSNPITREPVGEDGYYRYTLRIGQNDYIVEIVDGTMYFSIDDFPVALPVGTHSFTVKVPANYTVDNSVIEVSFTIITEPARPDKAEVPTITKHPESAEYGLNTQAAELSVTATNSDGGTLSYQWYENTSDSNQNGKLIPAATSANYQPSTGKAGTYYYYCEITNTNEMAINVKTAKAISHTARITVSKGEPQVSVSLQDWSYGEKALSPVITPNTYSEGSVTYTYTGTTKAGKQYGPTKKVPSEAGEYTIEAAFPETQDYKAATATDKFIIKQTALSIHEVKVQNKLWDGTDTATVETVIFQGPDGKEISLVKDRDYQVSARFESAELGENKNVEVQVTLLNHNYSLAVSSFTAGGAVIYDYLKDIWVAGIEEEVDYTGNKITQKFQVYDGNKLLTEKVDYSVSYKNNVNAYEIGVDNADEFNAQKAPQLIIQMKGNYSGKQIVYFKIMKADIGEAVADNMAVTYTGKKQTPIPVVIWNGVKLSNNKDFYVDEYLIEKTNKTAFTQATQKDAPYELTVVGKGNYTGTKTIYLSIGEKSSELQEIPMSKVNVSGVKTLLWTEEAQSDTGLQQQNLTIKYGKDILEKDKDYHISYENNKAVGTATIILEGTGTDEDGDKLAYIGTRRITFKITGINISKASVSGLEKSYIYTGDEIKPTEPMEGYNGGEAVTFSYQADRKTAPVDLEEGVHYTIKYEKNIAKGTAAIILDGREEAGFTGTKKVTFKITAAPIKTGEDQPFDIALVGDSVMTDEPYEVLYQKGGAKPEVKVTTSGGYVLKNGIDYTVSYKNNKAVVDCNAVSINKAPTAVIKGKGNFSGTAEIRFSIIKKNVNDSNDVYLVVKDKAENLKTNGWKQSFKVYDTDGKALDSKDYTARDVKYTIKSVSGDGEGAVEGTNLTENPTTKVQAGSVVEIEVNLTGANYEGTVKGTYRILKPGYDISRAVIQINDQYYTGKAIEITDHKQFKQATIKIGKDVIQLELGKDFEIQEDSYINHTNKGTAKVTIKGKEGSDLGGTKTVTFKIVQKSILDNWTGQIEQGAVK